MDGDHGLSDLRFVGYDNAYLAQQVDGLRNGPGPQSLHDAAKALIVLAGSLAETDRVLREQLQQLGVSWEGQAAQGGVQATQDAAVYADEAVKPVGDSAAGVTTQGGQFSHTRNSAPDAGTLRGPTELTGWDRFAGAFGHTTDNAQRVKETNAAREQAVAGLEGYARGSQDSLERARTLPVPPGMDLVALPPDPGTSVSSVGVPTTGGAGPSGSGTPGAPGGSNLPGPLPGGGPTGQGPLGGPPGSPGTPAAPGPTTGIGPTVPPGQGVPPGPGAPNAPRPVPSMFLPAAAALANAGAAGAAVGAGTEKDRLVRGRPGAPGAAGAPGTSGQERPLPKGATPLATPPDDEARAVRNAERFGAKPGKPGGASILQPATGTARPEEDATHVRKYGIDSGDLFGDERPIAPDTIGGPETEDQKKAD